MHGQRSPDGKVELWSSTCESRLTNSLPVYVDQFLERGAVGPVFIFVSSIGVQNAEYMLSPNLTTGNGCGELKPTDNVLLLPGIDFMKGPEDVPTSLGPWFDLTANAFGYSRCLNYDSVEIALYGLICRSQNLHNLRAVSRQPLFW